MLQDWPGQGWWALALPRLETLAWVSGGWVLHTRGSREAATVQAAAVTSRDRRVRTTPCPAFLQTTTVLTFNRSRCINFPNKAAGVPAGAAIRGIICHLRVFLFLQLLTIKHL